MKGNLEKAFGMSLGILLGNVLSGLLSQPQPFAEEAVTFDIMDLAASFAVSFVVSFLLFGLMDLLQKPMA